MDKKKWEAIYTQCSGMRGDGIRVGGKNREQKRRRHRNIRRKKKKRSTKKDKWVRKTSGWRGQQPSNATRNGFGVDKRSG